MGARRGGGQAYAVAPPPGNSNKNFKKEDDTKDVQKILTCKRPPSYVM